VVKSILFPRDALTPEIISGNRQQKIRRDGIKPTRLRFMQV
jgi:hypothetical protein